MFCILIIIETNGPNCVVVSIGDCGPPGPGSNPGSDLLKRDFMKLKNILIIIVILIAIIAIIVVYFYSSNLKSSCNQLALPGGYTCTNFKVVKVLEGTNCKDYRDCTNLLPIEYAVMSNCPYKSICLADKCTVVCPDKVSK